ncbi:MAG: transcriptional regulator with XRE-family HTH domain [Flavobacteriales bacterium]|jgi:transcriptional regulator with XRE-family HTH domain
MAIKDQLAATIKAQRLEKGLSQDKLSAKADISTRYYQDIEAGEKQPTVDTIFKLANALGESYTVLLGPVWSEWVGD